MKLANRRLVKTHQFQNGIPKLYYFIVRPHKADLNHAEKVEFGGNIIL